MEKKYTSGWRRPYCAIYNSNYGFGESLYSSKINEIEKRNHDLQYRVLYPIIHPELQFHTHLQPEYDFESRRALTAMNFIDTLNTSRLLAGTHHIYPDYGRHVSDSFTSYLSARSLAAIELDLEACKARRKRFSKFNDYLLY